MADCSLNEPTTVAAINVVMGVVREALIHAGKQGGKMWRGENGRWKGSPRDLFAIGMKIVGEVINGNSASPGKFNYMLEVLYDAAGLEPGESPSFATNVRKYGPCPSRRQPGDEYSPSAAPTARGTYSLLMQMALHEQLPGFLPPLNLSPEDHARLAAWEAEANELPPQTLAARWSDLEGDPLIGAANGPDAP